VANEELYVRWGSKAEEGDGVGVVNVSELKILAFCTLFLLTKWGSPGACFSKVLVTFWVQKAIL